MSGHNRTYLLGIVSRMVGECSKVRRERDQLCADEGELIDSVVYSLVRLKGSLESNPEKPVSPLTSPAQESPALSEGISAQPLP